VIMRFCFSITGQLRFLAHLDFSRMWGRACRRAGLELAYSEGFNPHPKMAFSPPRPVGMSGLNEYGDVHLSCDMTPALFIDTLQPELPQGLLLTRAGVILPGEKSLIAAAVSASYTVIWPVAADFRPEKAINDLLSAETLPFKRQTPKGIKEKDLRPGIFNIIISKDEQSGAGKIWLHLALSGNNSVRPDDVLSLLSMPPGIYEITRENIFRNDGSPLMA